MNITQFYIRRCPNGHMLYGEQSLEDNLYCWKCGEPYFLQCDGCNTSLPNAFQSYRHALNGDPWKLPNRPDHCKQCGKPYPWTKKELQKIEDSGFWSMLHPEVIDLAKRRFESGHNADAVEAVFKQLNTKVKRIYSEKKVRSVTALI